MGNSCTSVFPNTCAWEQQEWNKTKTDDEGKKRGVSMERRSPDGPSHPNRNTIIININNIPWLSPSTRRGTHVKSDNTHTIISINPLAHIPDICTLIFSSCVPCTVYPIHLQVITTRAREGGPKEHRAKQKWPSETHSVTYVPGFSTLSDLVAQPPPSWSVAQGHLRTIHPGK